jgi:hypothetical protein
MFDNDYSDDLLVIIFSPIMLLGFLSALLSLIFQIFYNEISINIINGLNWFSIAGIFASSIVFPRILYSNKQ